MARIEGDASLSRRGMLRAAAGVGAAASSTAARAEANRGRDLAGRRFKGFATFPGRGGQTVDLTLLAIGPRDVVVRSEVAITTYTMTRAALAPPAGSPQPAEGGRWTLQGQGCVGVVEQVGPSVKRFQVGDRAVMCVNPQCGQCYQCLTGRADWCQVLSEPIRPFATMNDGAPVFPAGGVGGISEYVVATEEWGLPVWSNLPAAQIMLMSNTAGIGLGTTMNTAPVFPGADVVVWGCGPVGLGAVQGARIRGAGQIIAVEPVKNRRELARRLGASITLDPM